MNKFIDKNIEEYYKLKVMKKTLDERLEHLNKIIKTQVLAQVDSVEPYVENLVDPSKGFTYESGDYTVVITPRIQTQIKPTVEVEQIITELGLWDECKKEVLDPDLIEQCYHEGKISDRTLRDLRAPSKGSLALSVSKVELNV